MWTLTTIEQVRQARRALCGKVALVPTMGALHDGHLSLIEAGLQVADHVIATIFVNPTQFGPDEDFTRYPRQLEKDLELCRRAGATGVFGPTADEIYPRTQLASDVNIPSLATILEGAVRPGHFAGVCRVVLKLLNITQPDVALFGQKDYQQLAVLRAMAADLCVPVEIIGCPTRREADGLAMSSRNVYLTAEQRRHAIGLYKALSDARVLVEQQQVTEPEAVERAMAQVIQAHQMQVDYAALRHPHLLTPLDCIEPRLTGGVVALVAARLGTVRLIDNMLLAPQG